MKGLSIRYSIFLSLLLFPLASFAHGMTDGMLAWAAMALSTTITFSHAFLILLIRWAKWFKNKWLMNLSIFISSLNVLIWLFALIGYTKGVSDILRRHDNVTALVLFVVLIVLFIVIIWTFKMPKKQHLQLNGTGEEE